MQTAAPRHTPFFALALLLVILVASLGGTSFQRKLDAFQPIGFAAQSLPGGWLVTEAPDPSTGLLSGDMLLLVQGERPLEATELRHLLTARDEAELVVQRGTDLIESITYQRPKLELDAPYLILVPIGLLYLLIGLYTAFKDRRHPARLFFLWCASSAALYILSPLPPRDATDELIFLADLVARLLVPALTLHLFLVFPTPLVSDFGRKALPALYLPSMLLGAFHADQIWLGGRFTGPPLESKLVLVDRIELCLVVLFSLLAIGALAVGTARRQGWQERRQAQWILLGMAAGWVPFLVLYVVPLILRLDLHLAWWPSWTATAAVLPLAIVPLTFAWAILRYKLLDIGSILRDSVTYSLTGLVGLFGFLLIHETIQRGVAQDLSLVRNLLTFSAGLLIAGVLVPTRSVIASGFERLRHRGTAAHRHALVELGQELLHERDLESLATTLVDRLAEGMMARTQLYLSRGDVLVPISATDDDLPGQLAFDDLGADFWQRETRGLSAVDLPGEGPSVEQRLFAAGLRYAFPIRVRGHRVGVALLSYKFQHEPLTSEDLDLVRALLDQAALAIENAQLLAEVHHQLDEVGRLERHTQGILESSPAGIAVINTENRIRSANYAFARIVGRDSDAINGQLLDEMLPITPLPRPSDGLIETSFCEMSGHERHLQLSVASYPQADGNELRVLIVQDRSEHHAMEASLKEKERLASLGMLAAGVAHEVNTPLTGISSYAQLLLADVEPDDPRREILKKMERQTFRAAQIVNNLLDFARNRDGELYPVDVGAMVDEAVSLVEERAITAGAQVEWTRPEDELSTLGNEGELHQVVTNLLVNALDAMAAMHEDERRLEVELQGAGERLVLQVRDSGPGIAPERLERIFQPFFSSKVGKGGTGLGLAITQNIVRHHRGTIRVTNRDDGATGCVFTVELPLHRR